MEADRGQMMISVMPASAYGCIELVVEPHDTIGKVKTMVECQEGTPRDRLHLTYEGKQLEDCQTIAYYNIQDDIEMVRQCEVIIESMTGETITVDVRDTDTPETIKAMIQVKACTLPDQYVLFRSRARLDKLEYPLWAYTIRHGSKLRLVPVPRHGFKISVLLRRGRHWNSEFYLNVEAGETIDSVKAKLEFINDTPRDTQHLIFKKQYLLDDHTLSDYNIVQGSLIVSLPATWIHIDIAMLTGQRMRLFVDASDTIAWVKDQIYFHWLRDIPQDRQRLTLGLQVLDDNHTIGDYDIQAGSTLQVVILSRPLG
jgi:uncharacterized ubiquitin-like protein YukD